MMDAGTAIAEGHRRRVGGDPIAAARWYRVALRLVPDGAEPWGSLAEMAADAGDHQGAAIRYGRAARAEPGSWRWRRLQAAAWLDAGDAAAAVAVLRPLLDERSDDIAALRLQAAALRGLGRIPDALACYREVLALDPDPGRDSGAAAVAFAELAIGAGDPLAAVEVLEPLLARRCVPSTAWLAVARAWAALDEGMKARNAVARYRNDGGDPAAAEPVLALLASAGTGLAPAYVRALFDRYADRFDENLVEALHYRLPALLAEAIMARTAGRQDLRILDLGCGTGLSGAAVRSVAAVLSGIDLSPRMIDKARERGIYDHLAVGDLQEALSTVSAGWDVILAADVLVYLGDLVPVFTGAAAALVPGGLFVGMVERLDQAEGWQLRDSRRFAHSAGHLRAAARTAGLDLDDPVPIVPRHDRGQPVRGWMFVATKR